MHTLRRSEAPHPQATWPVWALWAVAPLVVALGIVGGMAAATFLAAPSPASAGEKQAAQAPPAGTSSEAVPAGTGASTGAPTSSVTAPGWPSAEPTVRPSAPTPGPTGPAQPPAAPRVVKDLRDAQAELNDHFSRYSDGSTTIDYIEYRVMRNVGLSVSLVGIVGGENYAAWNRALQQNPQRLRAWLETAAARVLPATSAENVFLAWAVVEVRPDRPTGFTAAEVKALDNGRYLVTRPLAATADPGQTTVTLRPVVTGTGGAPAQNTPWATYGPQIRGDSTDIYRPMGISGR